MIEDPRTKMVRYIIIYTVLTVGAIVMMVPLLMDRLNFVENARQDHHSPA